MLEDTNGRIGPAPSWKALERMVGKPSPEIEDKDADILCWHDGPQISIARLPGSDSCFLEIHHADGSDTRPPDGDYPVWSRRVAHILEFPDRRSIEATLHDGFVPTTETYDAALRIQRVVTEWTLHAPHAASDMYETRLTVARGDVPDGEMPYDHLRPNGPHVGGGAS